MHPDLHHQLFRSCEDPIDPIDDYCLLRPMFLWKHIPFDAWSSICSNFSSTRALPISVQLDRVLRFCLLSGTLQRPRRQDRSYFTGSHLSTPKPQLAAMGAVTAPAAKLIALDIVLLALATGAVTLRMISIRIRRRTLKAHDSLCLFSLVSGRDLISGQGTDGGDSSVWSDILLISSLVSPSVVLAPGILFRVNVIDLNQARSMVVQAFISRIFRPQRLLSRSRYAFTE